jgi:hypothetical protein
MTIRIQISRKKRKLLIITYSGIAFFILGMVLSDKLELSPFWPFIGFAVFFVLIMLYGFWGMRCPRCQCNLANVTMYYGPPLSVSKKIKYCPFCGIDIDTEFKEQNQV